MAKENHYFREFVFRFGDCETYKRGTVFSIMKLLTELSGEDYENKGLGHSFLLDRGQTFLIARMRLEFNRIPQYSETVVAETWERNVKGPYFYREYDVRGQNGEQIIAGTGMWLLVNPISREILRPAALVGGLPEENPETVGCASCKKLKLNQDLPFLGRRPIYYSDLDSNGHVNNAVYGKIATDFLPDTLREVPVKAVDITFNMETKLGETLELHGAEIPGGFALQGVTDGSLHFACEFELLA